jgi:Spondin_N
LAQLTLMDAGTDTGFTFTSPNWPSDPPQPISVITAHMPDHPASSFYYPDLKHLPVIATLQFTKVTFQQSNFRLIIMQCDDYEMYMLIFVLPFSFKLLINHGNMSPFEPVK